MANVYHLARRFFTSLSTAPPDSRDNAWALRHLNEGETKLWKKMDNPDRRHALEVANAVGYELGPDVPREVIAAALLHDVGKIESEFGTFSRVFATVFWSLADDDKADAWSDEDTLRGRLARYRQHPRIGSELLSAAGAHDLTAAWAAEHHMPRAEVTVPAEFADILRACDND